MGAWQNDVPVIFITTGPAHPEIAAICGYPPTGHRLLVFRPSRLDLVNLWQRPKIGISTNFTNKIIRVSGLDQAFSNDRVNCGAVFRKHSCLFEALTGRNL